MTAGQTLETWLAAEVDPYLEPQGFRRNGLEYVVEGEGNLGFVWLEVVRSTPSLVEVAPQLGILSRRLHALHAALAGHEPSPPHPHSCIVVSSLGYLCGNDPLTWTVEQATTLAQRRALGGEARAALDIGIAWLRSNLPDSAIRDAWLGDPAMLHPWTRRLLLHLLVELGPVDRIPAIVAILDDPPTYDLDLLTQEMSASIGLGPEAATGAGPYTDAYGRRWRRGPAAP